MTSDKVPPIAGVMSPQGQASVCFPTRWGRFAKVSLHVANLRLASARVQFKHCRKIHKTCPVSFYPSEMGHFSACRAH